MWGESSVTLAWTETVWQAFEDYMWRIRQAVGLPRDCEKGKTPSGYRQTVKGLPMYTGITLVSN